MYGEHDYPNLVLRIEVHGLAGIWIWNTDCAKEDEDEQRGTSRVDNAHKHTVKGTWYSISRLEALLEYWILPTSQIVYFVVNGWQGKFRLIDLHCFRNG